MFARRRSRLPELKRPGKSEASFERQRAVHARDQRCCVAAKPLADAPNRAGQRRILTRASGERPRPEQLCDGPERLMNMQLADQTLGPDRVELAPAQLELTVHVHHEPLPTLRNDQIRRRTEAMFVLDLR